MDKRGEEWEMKTGEGKEERNRSNTKKIGKANIIIYLLISCYVIKLIIYRREWWKERKNLREQEERKGKGEDSKMKEAKEDRERI